MNVADIDSLDDVDTDTSGTVVHPSENPAYVAAHRVAFHTIDAPTVLRVGDRVWIVDHYYPGYVSYVSPDRVAHVTTTEWDYDRERPYLIRGVVATCVLCYGRESYRQLRVDPASQAFWPTPEGWNSIEA